MSGTGAAEAQAGWVARVRAQVAAVHRVVTLGLATVIVASVLRWAISMNVLWPLLGRHGLGLSPGVGTDLLLAVYQQIALLVVLPLLAWGAGWLFEGRPLPLTVGAAVFHELSMILMAYLSDGLGAALARPLYLGTRLLLALGIAWIAARAFARSRASLEAMSAGRRRIAPRPTVEGAAGGEPAPPGEEAPRGEAPAGSKSAAALAGGSGSSGDEPERP